MLVFNDTRCLVKKRPSILGLIRQNPVDLSLSDDRIAFFSDSCVIKEFVNIAQTAHCPVQKILALAAPIDPAGNRHFPIIDGESPVGVVQSDRNISKAKRPARLGPREDNILHRRPAQLLDSLLTQHPPDCIRDIALAAAVRPHNSGYAVMKFKFDLVCKGLKALNLNTF